MFNEYTTLHKKNGVKEPITPVIDDSDLVKKGELKTINFKSIEGIGNITIQTATGNDNTNNDTIVLLGDEQLGGDFFKCNFESIANYFGYDVIDLTCDGATVEQLLIMGGEECVLNNQITIPADSDTEVNISVDLLANGNKGYTLPNYNDFQYPFDINGINGIIFEAEDHIDVTGLVFYNKRNENEVLDVVIQGSGTYVYDHNLIEDYEKFRVCVHKNNLAIAQLYTNYTTYDINTICRNTGRILSNGTIDTSDDNYRYSDLLSVENKDSSDISFVYKNLAYSNNCSFKRMYDGDSMDCSSFIKCHYITKELLNTSCTIFKGGVNNGYGNDSYEDITNTIKGFAISHDKLLITNSLGIESLSYELYMRSNFGSKFCNTGSYGATQMKFDGIRLGLFTEEEYNTFISHLTYNDNFGAGYLQAVYIWNNLVDQGYVYGSHVNNDGNTITVRKVTDSDKDTLFVASSPYDNWWEEDWW